MTKWNLEKKFYFGLWLQWDEFCMWGNMWAKGRQKQETGSSYLQPRTKSVTQVAGKRMPLWTLESCSHISFRKAPKGFIIPPKSTSNSVPQSSRGAFLIQITTITVLEEGRSNVTKGWVSNTLWMVFKWCKDNNQVMEAQSLQLIASASLRNTSIWSFIGGCILTSRIIGTF